MYILRMVGVGGWPNCPHSIALDRTLWNNYLFDSVDLWGDSLVRFQNYGTTCETCSI